MSSSGAEVAYETPDGVYFEVRRIAGYGLLAHQNLESLRAGARVEASEEKRIPIDFALWKKAKPGEPSGCRRSGRAVPDGTPSAWRCRSSFSGRVSTCMAAGRT